MKKFIFSFLVLMLMGSGLEAQKYFTRDGVVSFYSDTPLEHIEAENTRATSIFDPETGKMEIVVLIEEFLFPQSMMQEKFKEINLESDKYPKALFKGEITNMDVVDFKRDGEYLASINGQLTIHGVTKSLESTGIYTVEEGRIKATTTFEVAPADFNIKIPALVKDNIANSILIKVKMDYEPFKK